MSQEFRHDLIEEGAVIARVATTLALFFSLQAILPDGSSDLWQSAIFVVELTASLVLTWILFGWLRGVRPRLAIRWYYPDGRPIEPDDLTITWVDPIPLYLLEIQVQYEEHGWLARRIGSYIRERYESFEIGLSASGARLVVEKGRSHISTSPDGRTLKIGIPESGQGLHDNATISINPAGGNSIVQAVIETKLSGSDEARYHNLMVRIDQGLKRMSMVHSRGEF